MAGTPIGRILLMPKGNYSGTAVYNSLDWVRHNGSAWVCTTDNTTGIAPAAGVPEWQLLAQDGNVSGTVDWPNVNFKPFEAVGSGLVVDVAGNLKLDIRLLTGSNISYDNSGSGAASRNVQDALDELFSGGGGGGLLPILHIISEDAATVTIADTDDLSTATITITPVHTGTGVWEGEVPDYGVWYVHSVLTGQGDQVKAVNVDDVAIIPVADYHFSATITASFSNGASCTCTDGITTLTATSNPYTFVVPNAGNWTVSSSLTLDGNTKTDSKAVSITSDGQSESVALSTEFGTVTVNVAQDFITAGSMITCTKGGMSCTSKPAASTITFRVPEIGTWEIVGVISGDTYTVDAVVSSLNTTVTVDLETLPDGKTVTPTDDIQIWLNCAGITNLSYTTLGEVLADHETLAKLISHENAVDYMVRSKTWIASKGLVPAMTDDTHPSGVVTASGENDGYEKYKAFDGKINEDVYTSNHGWWPSAGSHATGDYIRYEFVNPILANKAFIKWSNSQSSKVKFQGSNNGTDWTDLTDELTLPGNSSYNSQDLWLDLNNSDEFKYYQMVFTTGGNHGGYGYKLQFYSPLGLTDDETAMRYIGKRNYAADTLLDDADWCDAIAKSDYYNSILNVAVPVMTSNTTPSGECINSSNDGATYYPYKAFDKDNNTYWSATTKTNEWLGYIFTNNVKVKAFKVRHKTDTAGLFGLKNFRIEKSLDNGTTWTDIYTGAMDSDEMVDAISANEDSTTHYRLYAIDNTHSSHIWVAELDFYGREDVSETDIDIYSAANDTVSITGNGVSLTCVTDATGHGTIAKSSLPAGTYMFTSSVAKDPNNLSNNYSKQITVGGLDDVYVMPDNALYWYGYMDNVESVLTSNGWGLGTTPLTFDTNMASLVRTGRTTGGIGTKNPVSGITKINTIIKANDTNINGGVNIDPVKSKYSSACAYYEATSVFPSANTWYYYGFTPTNSLDGYIQMWSDLNNTVDWAAFWYDTE